MKGTISPRFLDRQADLERALTASRSELRETHDVPTPVLEWLDGALAIFLQNVRTELAARKLPQE